MPARLPSFWFKVGLAVASALAADLLLWGSRGFGLNLALLTLFWTSALGMANPAVRREPLARAALVAAVLTAALQAERATAVGLLLFALTIGVAALAPRAGRGDDGYAWAGRLLGAGLKAAVAPLLDLKALREAAVRRRPRETRLLALLLPLVGGAVFLWLFALANPVIEAAFAALRLPNLEFPRLVLWALAGFVAWTVLRPRGVRRTADPPRLTPKLRPMGVTPNVIVASLAVFNLVFALQNGLDTAYLWSGAGLPDGMTFAAYAHRGAYPLIATAILAGLFVLVFLPPASESAADRRVRALVVVWTGQNLFLVASTILRTLDYIEAYSLTRMRIAALIWTGLVAVGLVLILWRLLAGRSSGWLINANLAAAGLVLAGCALVDLGSIAASWNVRHAAEVGGRGVPLDLCYVAGLRGAGLVPLARLEGRLPAGDLRERVQAVRRATQARVSAEVSDWRAFRWRDARRLAQARSLVGDAPPDPRPVPRGCDGRPLPAPVVSPLTPPPNPGT
jgi:hypothetical protein